MKRLLAIICILPCIAFASSDLEFRMWKDILGREFEAKMVSATFKKVKLENRAGKQIEMPIADFLKPHRDYIKSNSVGADAVEQASAAEKPESKILQAVANKTTGKLNQNADYIALYFSAHWCPPCRKFTPKLSEFYDSNFKKGGNFDILFISSDRSEDAMEEYMEWGEMNFPAIKYKSRERATEIMQYSGRGIPCLVLVDRDGKVIADSYDGERFLGPNHVLKELANLVK